MFMGIFDILTAVHNKCTYLVMLHHFGVPETPDFKVVLYAFKEFGCCGMSHRKNLIIIDDKMIEHNKSRAMKESHSFLRGSRPPRNPTKVRIVKAEEIPRTYTMMKAIVVMA